MNTRSTRIAAVFLTEDGEGNGHVGFLPDGEAISFSRTVVDELLWDVARQLGDENFTASPMGVGWGPDNR